MIEQEVEEIMDDEEEIRKKYFLAINEDGVEEISKHLAIDSVTGLLMRN